MIQNPDIDPTHSFTHWIELRQRLLSCLIAFTVIAAPCIFFASELFSAISGPLLRLTPSPFPLVATQVISPFTTPLRLAMITSFVLCIPYFFYHLWSFIAPGLYRHEKQLIGPLMLLSTLLFYSGIVFSYFLVCPLAFHFFSHMAPQGVTVMTDMKDYLNFVLALMFSFGIAFQVPLLVFLLLRLGWLNEAMIKQSRPYIVIGAFVVGMLLTPPDVLSQVMLAVPLLVLFELGVLAAKYLPQRKSNAIS